MTTVIAVLAVVVGAAATTANLWWPALAVAFHPSTTLPTPYPLATCAAPAPAPKGVQSISVLEKQQTTDCWHSVVPSATATRPIYLEIGYFNETPVQENNVTLWIHLPKGVEEVPGTSELRNSQNPNAKGIPDLLATSGINIGNYASDADGYVLVQLQFPVVEDSCRYANTTVPVTMHSTAVDGDRFAQSIDAYFYLPASCRS